MKVQEQSAAYLAQTISGEWCEKPLRELVTKLVDGSHNPPPKQDTGLPMLSARNIENNSIVFNEYRLISESAFKSEHARTRIIAGDVLLTIVGTIGRAAVVPESAAPFALQRSVAVLSPGPELLPKFLVYQLQSPAIQRYFEANARGTAQKGVYLKTLGQTPIQVAPLDQQKRIVAEIEKQFSRLDEAVANLKRVKANLRRYKAAVFKAAVEGKCTAAWREQNPDTEPANELLKLTVAPPRPNRYSTRSMDVIPGHAALAVGNPGTELPDGWPWSALVDIARMESGHTPSRGHPEWWEGDVPWIGIADAREHHGKLIADTAQHTNDAGLANSAARLLPAGTVCISRTASVGYVVVMAKPMATSQDFVNWTPTQAVTSDWLRIVFLADREALIRFGKGSVHKTIYFPEWLSMHIAVPPLAEQNRIVAEVERLLSLADEAEAQVNANLQRAVSLRQSILQRAFSQ